ncbi:hypothetical protein HMPREF9069_01150, partial [Atopobium sp. oral taxon 810 str. F0209]
MSQPQVATGSGDHTPAVGHAGEVRVRDSRPPYGTPRAKRHTLFHAECQKPRS